MIEKISQGPTFKGTISTLGSVLFVIGFIVTISGIFSSNPFLIIPIGMVMILVGIVLFLAICGVLIDYEKRVIKPYFDILFAKIGVWESLDRYEKLVLKYTSETTTLSNMFNSTDILTKSFEIVLTSTFNEELYIKEFIEYKDAKVFLAEHSLRMNKLNQDNYDLFRQQMQERRKLIRK